MICGNARYLAPCCAVRAAGGERLKTSPQTACAATGRRSSTLCATKGGDWGEYPTLAAVESALIEQCVFEYLAEMPEAR